MSRSEISSDTAASAPVQPPKTARPVKTRFGIGQIVHHRLYDYRGVVYDIDPEFSGSEEWYETVARSRPAKDQPWYHVMVDDATHTTYVAEANLEADDEDAPIRHPGLEEHFLGFADGGYKPRSLYN